MAAAPSSPADPHPRRIRFPRSRRGRFLVVGFVALAVLGGSAGSWVYFSGLPPRLLAILGAGTLLIEVPMMTLYTLPKLGVNGSVVSETGLNELDFVVVRWSGWAEGLPVRVTLREQTNASPYYSFTEIDTGTWLYRVSRGSEGFGVELPSAEEVVSHFWNVQFTARAMARYEGFLEVRWIEILLLPLTSGGAACHMPCANVSPPASDDLMATGVVDHVDLAGMWQYARAIGEFELPDRSFRNILPDQVIDAGAEGPVTLHMETEFHWGAAPLHRIASAGEGPVSFSVTWYWDGRFGSLYPVVG